MMYFEIRDYLLLVLILCQKHLRHPQWKEGLFPKHFYNNMLAVLLCKRLTNFFNRYLAQLTHVLFGIRKLNGIFSHLGVQ